MASKKDSIVRQGVDKAYKEGLRLLSYRARTGKEIETRLQKKGFSRQDIGGALSLLIEKGYINDREFAREWAAGAVDQRRFGPLRLEIELIKKGVSREIACQAARQALNGIGEEQLARDILEIKIGRRGYPADKREQKRIIDHLARKGFAMSTINNVLSEVMKSLERE